MSKRKIDDNTELQIRTWFAEGRGVKMWRSIDLGRAGAVVYTSGDATKPCYWVSSEPVEMQPENFEVVTYEEVKRFRVGLRRAGLALKVTDGGSRRIRRECEKAGENSSYKFDYSTQEAVILRAVGTRPLVETSSPVVSATS